MVLGERNGLAEAAEHCLRVASVHCVQVLADHEYLKFSNGDKDLHGACWDSKKWDYRTRGASISPAIGHCLLAEFLVRIAIDIAEE